VDLREQHPTQRGSASLTDLPALRHEVDALEIARTVASNSSLSDVSSSTRTSDETGASNGHRRTVPRDHGFQTAAEIAIFDRSWYKRAASSGDGSLFASEALRAREQCMNATSAVTLLGGLGLFLLGIHHLTEGLKGLAGDSLRRGLQRLVSGRFSAVASGAVFTAVIQSSTAAILTVIGFVSVGLVTFSQAIGVIMGATLGTTSTPWLLAIFGFRVRIATAALPILGVGALLWIVAKGKTRSLGAILAGFGLLFTAIEYMQTGMKGVSWNFEAFTGPGSQWILAGIGIVMTIVMQS